MLVSTLNTEDWDDLGGSYISQTSNETHSLIYELLEAQSEGHAFVTFQNSDGIEISVSEVEVIMQENLNDKSIKYSPQPLVVDTNEGGRG